MLGAQPLVAILTTADWERARNFYVRVLGLTFVSNDPFATVLYAHGTTVRIAKVQQVTPAAHTALGWVVNEIEAKVRGLMGFGVAFERYQGFTQDDLGIWNAPDGSKVAWFKDPDGNLLSLSQHR